MERSHAEILREKRILKDIARYLEEGENEASGRGDNAVRDLGSITRESGDGFGLVVFASNCMAFQG